MQEIWIFIWINGVISSPEYPDFHPGYPVFDKKILVDYREMVEVWKSLASNVSKRKRYGWLP